MCYELEKTMACLAVGRSGVGVVLGRMHRPVCMSRLGLVI